MVLILQKYLNFYILKGIKTSSGIYFDREDLSSEMIPVDKV